MPDKPISINRAPVLTLWAVVVAERMGFDANAALSLGKAVAGLNAQSKGRHLGIYGPPQKKPDVKTSDQVEPIWVNLCGRNIPCRETDQGIRAVIKDKAVDSASAQRYLSGKYGENLFTVKQAMSELAHSLSKEDLAKVSYSLYERFRPSIPPGRRGWGAAGELDLEYIRSLANSK